MKKSFTKSVIAAALALPVLAFAGTSAITFDANGTGAGQQFSVDVLDWLPGNAISIGGNPGTGDIQPGTITQLLYQANLGTVSRNGVAVATGGLSGAQNFTLVVGVKEVVLANTGIGVSFGFADAQKSSATNFFKIYANQFGDNLAGTGFAQAGGLLVASGYISDVVSSSYATGLNVTFDANGLPVITPKVGIFDNYLTNNYVGTTSLWGSGTTDLLSVIEFADTNYFPDLTSVSAMTLGFSNTSVVTPFNQADPSHKFSLDGIADGNYAANIGTENGVVNNSGVRRDFQFQADGNTAFEVPEPDSLALAGLALGFAGFLGRRRAKKA